MSSTIGYERVHSPMLQIADREESVDAALAKLGHQPPNFQAIVAINHGPLMTEAPELEALDAEAVEAHRRAGSLLVDIRTDVEFDRRHIPGSVPIPIGKAGFGSKLASVADPEQEIVFIGDHEVDSRRAGRLARAIGMTKLAGFLDGGVGTWRDLGHPVEASSAAVGAIA